MLEKLKERVCRQNVLLRESGLVVLTWGNVSAFDRNTGLIIIKPSGVEYDKMTPDDMVVLRADGTILEGGKRPSSDTPTHLYLYNKYPFLGGIVHTHSTYATAFAQAGIPIPPLGTTHADAFYGEIPCTRALTEDEIKGEYEKSTGKVIAETLSDPYSVPGVLVKSHGVFTMGNSPEKAVENAITLEETAKIAFLTKMLNPDAENIPQALLDKHYLRKHGKNAYYGQN